MVPPTPTVAGPASETIQSERLSHEQIVTVGVAAAGYLCCSFETYIASFAMPAIVGEWKLSPVFDGLLVSAGMWGMFVGAMVWGPISDRFGRKVGFVITVVGFSVLSGLTMLAADATTFLVFRGLSGLFLGGMLPIASIMVAEQAPDHRRGQLVAFPPIFWPVGLFVAAVTSFALVPRYGWRSLFVVGMLPIVLALYAATKLPESSRWLAARDKERLIMKDSCERCEPAEETSPRESASVTSARGGVPLGLLLQPLYRKRLAATTSILFCGFFGYYGFLLWLPSILAMRFNLGLARAFSYTILVGVLAVFGKLTAFFTVDRFGRRQLLYVGYGMSSVISLLFGFLHDPRMLLAGACALSFFLEEAAAGCVVLPTELFPSEVRGTANSWSSAAGKLAAALSPLVFGFFMARQLYFGIFATMAAFFIIACVVLFALNVEGKGKALSEISAA